MIVTTGNDLQGMEIAEYLGVVRGIVVRASGLKIGIIGGLKSLAGGYIQDFAKVCEEARIQAFNQLIQHAHDIGADAIIGMRYDATEFGQGITEVLAYGTAVKLKK
ncbi:MAG TPA: YbjQ family protein [Pyrinomonadaceae bacterium]|nr:YbjQ family protein [Pyrinomonadaceae bacterium]